MTPVATFGALDASWQSFLLSPLSTTVPIRMTATSFPESHAFHYLLGMYLKMKRFPAPQRLI